jgi:hypothetical protein
MVMKPNMWSSWSLLGLVATICVGMFLWLGSPVAAADTGATVTAQAQADSVSDVPLNSWAYDAVAKLAADGFIKGYPPDGKFRGERPMTRYEVAVLVSRAVDSFQAKLSAGEQIDKSDVATLQRLVDAFVAEVKNVESRVAALETKTTQTSQQVNNLQQTVTNVANTQKAMQLHATYWVRPGLFAQDVGATNGPIALARGTIAPNGQIPGGYGPAPIGNGILGATGTGVVGPQNSLVTGAYNHGVAWQDIRLVLNGSLPSGVNYLVRLEDKLNDSTPNYQTTTNPGYCTSTGASNVPGVNLCNSQDYFGNSSFRVNLAFAGYASPGGFFTRIGIFPEEEGIQNAILLTQGASTPGVQIGYSSKKLNAWLGYSLIDAALTNKALNNANCAYPITTCVQDTRQGILGKADYNISSKTNIGVSYNGYHGVGVAEWNPAAGLCSANVGAPAGTAGITTLNTSFACPANTGYIATAAGPVTGAYQNAESSVVTGGFYASQLIGKTMRIEVENSHRFGKDPFTGGGWIGSNAYAVQFDYASKGNMALGPIYPGLGATNSNVFEGSYQVAGFNSLGPDSGPGGSLPYQSFYYTAPNGLQWYWLTAQHWFSPNVALGLVYQGFELKNHTNIPAGSLTCPGCFVSSLSSHALFLDAHFVF